MTTPDEPRTGPLAGIRVIDASTILAGPLACQILGDFGAEVIKIEHPVAGDGMRGHGPAKDGTPIWWSEISRNKRTLALSLSAPAGAEVFLRLAATADVVVENFRPGTLERWGLGPDVLLELNPRLVLAGITGFGQQGPYAARAGFGTLAEAMSGFAHLTGQADGPPTLPAFGLADSICGIAASSAISMALFERERNGGRGQVLDLSLLEPIMAAVGPGPTVFQQTGAIGTRHGNRSTNNAPRNTYRTADDHWVAISTSAQAIAERVLRLVGHPEVIDEPWFASGHTRAEHADLLDEYVGGWIAERTRDDVVAAFTEAGAAIAPIYTARDLVEDEHVQATAMLTEVEDPALGQVLQHNVMWRMSETPGAIRFAGRPLGADTDAVLAELGLSPDEIAHLRDRDHPVTDPTTAQLLAAVQSGLRVVDLGRQLTVGMPQSPNHPAYWHAHPRRHGDMVRGDGGSAANDMISMGTHVGTHVDALSHVSQDGKLHGDKTMVELGVHTVQPMVRRGVLLDVPATLGVDRLEAGQEITVADLEATIAKQGTTIGAGDVVLVRSGWGQHFDNGDGDTFRGLSTGVPGVGEAGATWLADHDVHAVGADTIAFERLAPGAGHGLLPAHRVLLVERGIYIVETMALEELARDAVHEFLFVLSPLPFFGATGSPVRPLAVVGA